MSEIIKRLEELFEKQTTQILYKISEINKEISEMDKRIRVLEIEAENIRKDKNKATRWIIILSSSTALLMGIIITFALAITINL